MRPNPTSAMLLLLLATIATVLPACAGNARPVFESTNAHIWPAPPDEPRIRFLGQLQSEDDLHPSHSVSRRLGDALFGRDQPIVLQTPSAVCSDGADRLFVADPAEQAVCVFDLARRTFTQWRPPKNRPPALNQPVALACDPSGRLLVSDADSARILAFSSSGVFRGEFATGRFTRPCGIAYDPTHKRILVVDAGAHQLVALTLEGQEIARIGGRGSKPGEFNFPTFVAVDATGRVYVSDTLNFRIQVFDPDLKPLRQIGKKGDMPGYFSQPKGLAVDAENHLYVVDANFESIQIFDDQGQVLMSFGREGHGPGEFWLPSGLCLDNSGKIFVADTFNKRVQAFEPIIGKVTP